MKKTSIIMAVLLIIVFSVFAVASTEDEGNGNQGSGAVNGESSTESDGSTESGQLNNSSDPKDETLGDYSVVIDSCRLAESFDGKPVVIVKYIFTNNKNDDATAFSFAFDDAVYQNGVGLNGAYVLKDSANYNSDNQTKEIKKGASIEVEVAYELNDTTTDIEVEVKELWSFSDKTLTKTFSISQ